MFDAFQVEQGYLLGHSLGGHVAARFAALFGDRLLGLILVDGFGPPRQQARRDIEQFALLQAAQVQALQHIGRSRKIMTDAQFAVARYQASNPRLDGAIAARLAMQGIAPAAAGGVSWRWDPRAQMVWSTFSHEDSEALLRQITCATCVITGSEGLDYWLLMHPELAGQQRLYEQELARRVALIAGAKSIVLKGAGHMVHYDAPDAFSQAVLDFLSASNPILNACRIGVARHKHLWITCSSVEALASIGRDCYQTHGAYRLRPGPGLVRSSSADEPACIRL